MEGTAVEAARSRFEQAMEEQARAQARNGHIAEWKNVFGPSFLLHFAEKVTKNSAIFDMRGPLTY